MPKLDFSNCKSHSYHTYLQCKSQLLHISYISEMYKSYIIVIQEKNYLPHIFETRNNETDVKIKESQSDFCLPKFVSLRINTMAYLQLMSICEGSQPLDGPTLKPTSQFQIRISKINNFPPITLSRLGILNVGDENFCQLILNFILGNSSPSCLII